MNICSHVGLKCIFCYFDAMKGKVVIMKKTYKIDVDCANCANKMEEAAKNTSGVKDAIVNFMTLKMIVEFEDGVMAAEVMKNVLKNCKHVEDDCEIFM
jgi:copper chaperone CopZ